MGDNINSLHKRKISFGESITVKWRLPYMARSVIFGHLRKQVRHSLIHQVGHIKVHHASLDTRTGKPPYCFPSYTLQKDHTDKTPSNHEYFVSFNKGVILKLCVQMWFNKFSFSHLFFNIIKTELNMNSRKILIGLKKFNDGN